MGRPSPRPRVAFLRPEKQARAKSRFFRRFVIFQGLAGRKISLPVVRSIRFSGCATGAAEGRRPTIRSRRPRREPFPRFPAVTGADFSPASSDFKALGAFFWSAGAAHGQSPARVPDFVGSRLPSPFSGRGFNLFKPLRRHFRAAPFFRQALSRRDPGDRNASVQKTDDRLGDLRREGGTRTNIERRRSFGKKIC